MLELKLEKSDKLFTQIELFEEKLIRKETCNKNGKTRSWKRC